MKQFTSFLLYITFCALVASIPFFSLLIRCLDILTRPFIAVWIIAIHLSIALGAYHHPWKIQITENKTLRISYLFLKIEYRKDDIWRIYIIRPGIIRINDLRSPFIRIVKEEEEKVIKVFSDRIYHHPE